MANKRLNNWALETVPQPGLGGRQGFQPRGKCLGGSSAINAMVYIRGHPSDYDDWAALGNEGWAYQDVLPYFRLSEHNERLNDEYHGQNGPLWVSDLRTDSPFHHYIADAAREAGLPVTADFNGAEQEGVGVFQVTQKDGERWSAARAYLLPHLQRPNLKVATLALAQRILFEDGRAVGVEYRQGERQRIVRARKEVILASGAFKTPQLLMLSGVGEREELVQHGIPLAHHLPKLGKNLRDHPDFVFGMTTQNPDTFSFTASGFNRLGRESWRYYRQRRGALTSNFAEAGAFLKSRPQLDRPDLQLHLVTGLVDDHGRNLHFKKGFSCHVCLLRPRSHGSVRLQSADPQEPPLIDPAFLHDPQDVEDLVAGYKLTQRLLDAPSLKQQILKYVFPLNINNDNDIRRILRQRVDTVYHPVGTCRMGIDDQAVVDLVRGQSRIPSQLTDVEANQTQHYGTN
ncbi:GMC family oxidoreductase [Ketobacter nezhaii]|uniref:GMC family oxidoreductase n=1 Tax=Ketobacter sp. MCCC 1A13808 TaxID=2602738 RepID=UPI0039836C68